MRDHSVGEGYPHLFQPDTLLPSQFFGAVGRRGKHEPELRLVIALLQDAIECFQKHLFARDNKTRQLHQDAEEWILSEDREYFFSFENVCLLLNLDAGWLREGLLRWREQRLAERTKRAYPARDAEQPLAAAS